MAQIKFYGPTSYPSAQAPSTFGFNQRVSKHTVAMPENGVVKSMSAWIGEVNGTDRRFRLGIYDSSDNLVGRTVIYSGEAIGSTLTLVSLNMEEEVTLAIGETYSLGYIVENVNSLYGLFAYVGSNASVHTTTWPDFTDPLGDAYDIGHQYGIYLSYTPIKYNSDTYEIDQNNPLTEGLAFATFFENSNTKPVLGTEAKDNSAGAGVDGWQQSGSTVLEYDRPEGLNPTTGTIVLMNFGQTNPIPATYAKFAVLNDSELNFQRSASDTSLRPVVNGELHTFTSLPDMFDNAEHQLAMRWNVSTLKVSVDSTHATNGINAWPTTAFTFPTLNFLNRAVSEGADRGTQSRIRYAFVWDRDLTDAEIESIQSNPYQLIKPKNPVFGFSFGATSPTVVPDAPDFTQSIDAQTAARIEYGNSDGFYHLGGVDVDAGFVNAGGMNDNGRDRGSWTGDGRLKGFWQQNNGAIYGQTVFKVDLPVAGLYRVRLAGGDNDYTKNTTLKIADSGIADRISFSELGTSIGQCFDAAGNLHAFADWEANNTTVLAEFSSGVAEISLGFDGTSTGDSALNYIEFELVEERLQRSKTTHYPSPADAWDGSKFTHTINHTVPDDANALVVRMAGTIRSSFASVQFAGRDMVLAGKQNDGNGAECFVYYLYNPPKGANDFIINLQTSAGDWEYFFDDLYDVDTTVAPDFQSADGYLASHSVTLTANRNAIALSVALIDDVETVSFGLNHTNEISNIACRSGYVCSSGSEYFRSDSLTVQAVNSAANFSAMAAVAFKYKPVPKILGSVGFGSASTSDLDVTPDFRLREGDVVLAVVNVNNDTLVSSFDGFTEEFANTYSGTSARAYIYSRKVTSDEPANFNITLPTLQRMSATLLHCRGVEPTSIFNLAPAALHDGSIPVTSSASFDVDSITTTEDNCLAVGVIYIDDGGTMSISGFTNDYESVIEQTASQHQVVLAKELGIAGATGNVDYTSTIQKPGLITHFALNPAENIISLVGDSDINRFDAGTVNLARLTGPYSWFNATAKTAAASGTATKIQLYINAWGATLDNVKFGLYDASRNLIATFEVPSSVGTGYIEFDLPISIPITSGSDYFLSLLTETNAEFSVYFDSATDNLMFHSDGSYASPVDPLPVGSVANPYEFYWGLKGTAEVSTTASIQANYIAAVRNDYAGKFENTVGFVGPTDDDPPLRRYRAGLNFDLSSIPAGATILGVTMDIDLSGIGAAGYNWAVQPYSGDVQVDTGPTIHAALDSITGAYITTLDLNAGTAIIDIPLAGAITTDIEAAIGGDFSIGMRQIEETVAQTAATLDIASLPTLNITFVDNGIYTDDFNRADENPITGDWGAELGTGLTIVSNEVNYTGSGETISSLSSLTFTDDQSAQLTFTAVANFDFLGLGVRFDGAGNGYIAFYDPSNTQIIVDRVDAGVRTNIATFVSVTVSATDTVRLDATGSTLEVFVNDVSVGSTTDATHASGSPAMYYRKENSAATKGDDFIATGFVSGGGGNTPVEQSTSFPWNSFEFVTASSVLQYSILQTVANSSQIDWDLLQQAISNTEVNWAMFNSATGSIEFDWDMFGNIVQGVSIEYDILQSVVRSVALDYNMLQKAESGPQLRWAILQQVVSQLGLEFNISQSVDRSVELVWNNDGVLGQAVGTTRFDWGIRNQIEQAMAAEWALLQSAGVSLELQYDILQQIEQAVVTSFDIRNSASNSVVVQWNSVSMVDGELLLDWNILTNNVSRPVEQMIVLKENRVVTVLKEDRIMIVK